MVADNYPLLDLLGQLKSQRYHFVAVTPATHALALEHPPPRPLGIRDIFGWNRPFDAAELDPSLLGYLQCSGAIEPAGKQWRAAVRVASLGNDLLLHSKYPTDDENAVFFGPDTYRFIRFIKEQLPRLNKPTWVVDMGAGSGAGGIVAAQMIPSARVTLVDINPQALELARTNAKSAAVCVETVETNEIPPGVDLVVANPPYMLDRGRRAYRHGGALFGGAVALDWVKQALRVLQPGGAMLLYTGAAVTKGKAPLVEAVQLACAQAGASVRIEELDPDVFGAELAAPAYKSVERIAVIGAVIQVN